MGDYWGSYTQVVLELVHDGVVKRLGTTIGVVGEGELAVVLGDGVSLGPQFLGLGGVELQVVGTLEGVGVARGLRGGELGGGGGCDAAGAS